MPDLFDTAGVPDDAAYWDALARRVAADAARAAAAPASGMDWLARAPAGRLVAALLIVAALALVSAPAQRPALPDARMELERALGPGDTLGQAVLSADRPPAVAALLVGGGDRGAR